MAGVKHLDLLRHVDPQACQAAHTIRCWQEQGHRAAISAPAVDRNYLSFVAQGPERAWKGAMDAQQWLDSVLPQLRVLLRDKCCDTYIAQLFTCVAQPFQPLARELQYHSLSSVELMAGSELQDLTLPCLETPQGMLWLTGNLPVCLPVPAPLPVWVTRFPLKVSMVMGIGQLQPRQLSHLAHGDVLVIAERTQHLSMAERCVGFFTLTEEGFRMELNPSALPLESSVENDKHAPGADAMQALHALPLKLEFVLQETLCNLTELANFQNGQVLPLKSSAQHSVEVRANGRVVAVGELVQWEGGLGVELHTVVRGVGE